MSNIKKIVETTTNRGEFNRAYKEYLAHKRNGIGCSFCKYHKGENNTSKWYGGNIYGKFNKNRNNVRYPNWKLISKNKKQWMMNNMEIIDECSKYTERTWFTFKF